MTTEEFLLPKLANSSTKILFMQVINLPYVDRGKWQENSMSLTCSLIKEWKVSSLWLGKESPDIEENDHPRIIKDIRGIVFSRLK